VIESVRSARPDDPVVVAVRGIISADQIALGEPIRAADALLVAKQLDAAIGDYPLVIAPKTSARPLRRLEPCSRAFNDVIRGRVRPPIL
jgi:hypothetical protein